VEERVLRIVPRAIRKNAGSDERSHARTPLTMKIFSLPNLATQSPRTGHFNRRSETRAHRQHIAYIKREFKKVLRHRHFLHA
jgi:hypothetical protein